MAKIEQKQVVVNEIKEKLENAGWYWSAPVA